MSARKRASTPSSVRMTRPRSVRGWLGKKLRNAGRMSAIGETNIEMRKRDFDEDDENDDDDEDPEPKE